MDKNEGGERVPLLVADKLGEEEDRGLEVSLTPTQIKGIFPTHLQRKSPHKHSDLAEIATHKLSA